VLIILRYTLQHRRTVSHNNIRFFFNSSFLVQSWGGSMSLSSFTFACTHYTS